MAVHITSAIAIAVCNAINAYLDAGSGPGTLVIYDGTRPANADTAVSGQVALVTFALHDPAFAPAAAVAGGGQATANDIDPVVAAATGTATWFRAYDSDGKSVFDGAVTDTTGTGDLKLSSTSIVTGIDVTVVSLTANMGTGAA